MKNLQRLPKGTKPKTKPAYAILELGTGYMDGWYFIPLAEVKDIAKWWNKARPQYKHRVIAEVEPFSLRHPVVFLADAWFGERRNGGAA